LTLNDYWGRVLQINISDNIERMVLLNMEQVHFLYSFGLYGITEEERKIIKDKCF
jgi:hypothetical protein